MFKSDRCGIEIRSRTAWFCTLWWFKSDRCGIEIWKKKICRKVCHKFKSDRCGIEMPWGNIADHTIVDVQIRPLRDWNEEMWVYRYIALYGSNQTVAGLKSVSPVSVDGTLKSFKSDRCGIEIVSKSGTSSTGRKFKSDRCGIEI